MNRLVLLAHLAKNMGWRYLAYRGSHEIKRRSGLLKRKFPVTANRKTFLSLAAWRHLPVHFFFNDKTEVNIPKLQDEQLANEFNKFINGEIRYFYDQYYKISYTNRWLINPQKKYVYDVNRHWTEVDDFSLDQGDIKFVWEQSRFCHLYPLVRYDYHFDHDAASLVFGDILTWIEANPLNRGPNYKCSQEISIRLLNWTFALFYYRHSTALSEEDFGTIINSIYRQTQHVYANINFSRKTVRNNHAITETLTLYLIGLLYPFFPESRRWREKGKRWFEQEILYQIYDDGSYLQFSLNYHRVVIQLLTWAFYLAKINRDKFSDAVYERGKKALDFLINMQDTYSGRLPNYGANDGSIFFKLNNCHYRDYRPQINALYYFFNQKNCYRDADCLEDARWYNRNFSEQKTPYQYKTLTRFEKGGFYVIRDNDSLSFIRCGKHRDRPSHADNLHLDIWFKGENIFHDAGTFQYNTDPELIRFFSGSSAHNTVTLGKNDQMKKGPRFIWLYWSQAINAALEESNDFFYFEGRIRAFHHLSKNITHKRIVKKYKQSPRWEIIDSIAGATDLPMIQHWNTRSKYDGFYSITAYDENSLKIEPQIQDAWYSSFYGAKEKSKLIRFKSNNNYIKTVISLNF